MESLRERGGPFWRHAGEIGLITACFCAVPLGSHAAAHAEEPHVYAVGDNKWGKLGVDNTWWPRPSLIADVQAIAGGSSYSLALKTNGTVWTWGRNSAGQLGNGTMTDQHTPVQVSGLSSVRAIAGGFYHSLALKTDGTVSAWGNNDDGQLGDGTTTGRTTPVPVGGLSDVKMVTAGGSHSLEPIPKPP